MSKADGLVVVGAISFIGGAALFLIGSSGSGIVLAAIVFVVGAIALVSAMVLRRGEPRTVADDVRPAGPSQVGKVGAFAVGALGTLALVLIFFVAQGEARGHGLMHLIFGATALGLFVALDRWWRPRKGSAAASLRTPLMVLLWIGTASSFLESIGAAGYDRFNTGARIPWLTSMHGFAVPLGAVSVLMIPIAALVLASVFAGRLRARRVAAG